MKPSSAKEKGRRFQQRIRDLFLKEAPELDTKDIRSVPMGVPGEDLWMSTKAEEVYPYSVECKNVEKFNAWAAIKQAREEAKKNGKTPLVAFSRNKEKTYVIIPIETLLELHSRLRDLSTGNLESDS